MTKISVEDDKNLLNSTYIKYQLQLPHKCFDKKSDLYSQSNSRIIFDHNWTPSCWVNTFYVVSVIIEI
jgi:hypothetical protein